MICEECTKTTLTDSHGAIDYFPSSATGRFIKECQWTFELPEQTEFIFHLEFDLLIAYEGDDDIHLPDGKTMTNCLLQCLDKLNAQHDSTGLSKTREWTFLFSPSAYFAIVVKARSAKQN